MNATTDLIPWNVPFANAKYPSANFITEAGDILVLVIAPSGTDEYPKFLVRFEKVIALLCYEEAYAFERGYRDLSGMNPHCCAFMWIDSPWLKSYRKGVEIFGWKEIQHYLILGGDNIIELIADGLPTIERVDKQVAIRVKHEI